MGSLPLAMSRSCASTDVFTLTISAYVSLVFFGLTAKQPLLSTVCAHRVGGRGRCVAPVCYKCHTMCKGKKSNMCYLI